VADVADGGRLRHAGVDLSAFTAGDGGERRIRTVRELGIA
jgi:hypothetical protein